MGAAHSHEDLEICESDEEEYEEYEERREEEEDEFVDSRDDTFVPSSSRLRPKRPSSSLDDVESKLRALKLKYPSTQQEAPPPSTQTSTKLFRYINGNTPKAKWVTAEKLTSYSFVKTSQGDDDDDRNRDSEKEWWVLKVGRSKIREKVSDEMQLKAYKDQRRVDFVAKGVWALRFGTVEDFAAFVSSYNNCLFENNHGVELNEASKAKIFGKDFIAWANPEAADDSMWEDADDLLLNSPQSATPVRDTQDLTEAFEEATSEGIHSLALGALDNSFLVGGSGIQVFKNMSQGIQGKGVCVNFEPGYGGAHSAPRKALLVRAETNMLLMSPMSQNRGIHQLDIETGKVISEWKFEKDGIDISMSDITNDGKGAQLDPSASTFLGLDNNRLCRWDMRDRYGMVQDLATANAPVLSWAQGHQFSRGTNFQCFATTGDGSIVTEDGKQERHVVATVGKFSVIWNFQQVKNGSHECYHEQEGLKKCYCYKIVLRNESIVDSRFMNDNFAVSGSPEAPLVIATPMKVSSFSLSSKR
ncbi:hypothetical protein DY000_02010071 [Brassica cretica]|uniref:Vacuolar import/degradation Vid27 C-terminal domain-containing protein n=1 Tax=Brassica cretica TaxID=69181 RepID=A0ABQ7C4D6_BRACR|nr:hypothetical protein DY000_02010071 [Brassica cretica]